MSVDLTSEHVYTGEIRVDDEVELHWVRGLTVPGWTGIRCEVLGFTPGGNLVISVPSYPELVRVPVQTVSTCWRNHVRQVSEPVPRSTATL